MVAIKTYIWKKMRESTPSRRPVRGVWTGCGPLPGPFFPLLFKHCQLAGFKIQPRHFLFKGDRFRLKRSGFKAQILPCCALISY